MSKVLPPLRILRAYIIEQYDIENKRKGNLRTSTVSKQHRTVILTLLDKSQSLLEQLEKAIYSKRSALSFSKLCKPIKLTGPQLQRKWSKELVPLLKHLQKCPACDHLSTNYPPENETIIEYNRKKESEFEEKTKKWDTYMKEKSNENKNAKTPEGMTWRPYRRDFKGPIIMCMCSMSYCLGDFDNAATSCPIKCMNTTDSPDKKINTKLNRTWFCIW